MPYPDYFSKIFTHIENLETYINKTTSVQWSGLKNIHVATAPYQRQGFTPLAKGATMVMDRYHLQREKWELLLETIGSTEMIQLLVNNFVFSELPRESFMQIAVYWEQQKQQQKQGHHHQKQQQQCQ
ncbi:hypothetical protein BC941DRAFT_447981 [Chlamydoabsidia padenii]|nr:hypothetical protein BC941DRAFT_447981 [Chlamydoabsidia padenii]